MWHICNTAILTRRIFAGKSNHMRSIIITSAIAALACTSATHAAAQGPVKKVMPVVVTVGVKAGLNMQQVDGTSFDDAYAAGIVGGPFVCISRKKIGVRVEGLVKSAKIDYAPPLTGSLKTVGLDVPVLLEYHLLKRLKLQAGPQFTTFLSAKDQAGVDVKNKLSSADVAVAAGVEVNLPLKFIVGARYIKGLTDIDKSSTGKMTTSTIQLTVGYRFLN